MLTARDPVDPPPRRILIAGVSGSGKTTLAARISTATGIPHTEIDALAHGPNWVMRESFVDDVDGFSRAERWITEWQYPAVRPMLAERADTLIWLDTPIALTMARVIRRTVRRRLRREVLWNGNVEGPLRTIFTDPEHIIRWAWSTRNAYRQRIDDAGAARPELRIVRLANRREIERWVAGL